MALGHALAQARKIIKKAKKPLMLYDTDTDGTTSYLQLKKAFPKITGYPFKYREGDRLDQFLADLEFTPDLVIIFDIPRLTEEFFEFLKESRIIWADHHLTNDKRLIEKYGVYHINPLNYNKKDNSPSAYLAYRVANKKSNLFYAAMGSVSDFYLLETIIDLYKYSKKEFRILFPHLDEYKRKELFTFIRKYDPFDGRVKKKRDYWIQYLRYEGGVEKFKNFFDTVFKMKYSDVIENLEKVRSLSPKKFSEAIDAAAEEPFIHYVEMLSRYKKVYKRASTVPDETKFFFSYEGDYGFTKTLSEEIAYRYKNVKMVAVAYRKPGKDYWQFSFRGRNYDVNEAVQKLFKGVDGSGGGHKFAAGARVHVNDFDTVKTRIEKLKV